MRGGGKQTDSEVQQQAVSEGCNRQTDKQVLSGPPQGIGVDVECATVLVCLSAINHLDTLLICQIPTGQIRKSNCIGWGQTQKELTVQCLEACVHWRVVAAVYILHKRYDTCFLLDEPTVYVNDL